MQGLEQIGFTELLASLFLTHHHEAGIAILVSQSFLGRLMCPFPCVTLIHYKT